MANGSISQRIFNTIMDMLENQGLQKQPAKGLIWREINKAHSRFVEDLGASRIEYEIPLFSDVTEYLLDDYILKIEGYKVNNPDDLHFVVTIPDALLEGKRFIKITDEDKTIRATGDVLTLTVEIRVPDDYEIDEEHDPLVHKRYHRLLEEYVIAGFIQGQVKVKGGGLMPVSIMRQQEIDQSVRKRVEDSNALDRVNVIPITQLYFH